MHIYTCITHKICFCTLIINSEVEIFFIGSTDMDIAIGHLCDLCELE